jgi:hypothetical protein
LLVDKMKFLRSRRLHAALFVAVFGSVALVALFLLTRRDVRPIEQGLYERVRLGMTEQEVAEAIPLPPGDYVGAFAYGTAGPIREGELPIGVTGDQKADGTLTGVHPHTGRPFHGRWWLGTEGFLIVFFGEDGRVIERRYYPGFPESFIGYAARRWLP